MILFLSLVLGIVPLLGIAWTVYTGTITTVDGLFMSLILFALSGILFLNAYWSFATSDIQEDRAAGAENELTWPLTQLRFRYRPRQRQPA